MVMNPSDRLARLAVLERCHDGPVPADEVPGAALSFLGRAAAFHALHQRLAVAARVGVARRRRGLKARAAPADVWLSRLTVTLAGHRSAAIALLGRSCGN